MSISAHHNFIYGGFLVTETDISQRDIKNNETVFTGDIGIEGNNSDNCYHVMRAVQILDVVTICHGNANGTLDPNRFGGGVYVYRASSIYRNCIFRDNYASINGGAVFMDTWGYDVVFENCLFYNNSAKYGGAIISYRYVTVINNCTFAKNTSVSGTGGIDLFNFGYSPHFADITNSVFYCNDSDDFYILDEATIPDINNCA
jgi:hypothetical protein